MQQEPRSVSGDAPRITFAPLNAIITVVGVLLILLAFTILNWFRPSDDFQGFFHLFGSHTNFAEMHDKISQLQTQVADQGLTGNVSFDSSAPYFSWVGWVLFALAAVFTTASASSLVENRWYLKWLAAVSAVAGVAMTFLALDVIVFAGNAPNNANAPSYGDFLSHSGVGAWAAIAGFALLAAAAFVPHPSR